MHLTRHVPTNPAATGISPWAGRPAASSPIPQAPAASASPPVTVTIGWAHPTTNDIPAAIALTCGRLTVELEAGRMVRSMPQQLGARSRKPKLFFSAMGCYRDRKNTSTETRPQLLYRGRQRASGSIDLVPLPRQLQLAPELIDDNGSPRTTSRTTCGNPSSSLAASQTETS